MLREKYEELDKKALDDPLNELDTTIREEYNKRLDIFNDNLQSLYDEYEDENGDIRYELLIGTLLFTNFKSTIRQELEGLEAIKNNNITQFFSNVYDEGFNGNKELLKDLTEIDDIDRININQSIKDETINQRLGGASTSERLQRDKNDTIFKANQRVENSIKDGNTYTQTKKELKGVIDDDYDGYMTIAETKGHTVVEESKKEFAIALLATAIEVTPIKIWNTQRDEKVRLAHNNANTQEKELDEPFEVGGELLDRPGDPAGSAKNIINCRCFLSYDVR